MSVTGKPSGVVVFDGYPSKNAAKPVPARSPLKFNPPRGTLAAPRKSEARRKSKPNFMLCAPRVHVMLSLTWCKLLKSYPLPPSCSDRVEKPEIVIVGTPVSRGVNLRLLSFKTRKPVNPNASTSKFVLARELSELSTERFQP